MPLIGVSNRNNLKYADENVLIAKREKTPVSSTLDGTVKENENGLTITQKGFHQKGEKWELKIGEVKIKKIQKCVF